MSTPLHPKIGAEIFLKPKYAVLQSKDLGVYSGRNLIVSVKPVLAKGNKEIHFHIRLNATEGRYHKKLEKVMVFDIDCYVEKEHFEETLRELIPHQKTLFDMTAGARV